MTFLSDKHARFTVKKSSFTPTPTLITFLKTTLYMERYLDFTVDKTNFAGLDGFVQKLHDSGKRFVPILDPVISSEENTPYNAWDTSNRSENGADIADLTFLHYENGSTYLGKMWPYAPTENCSNRKDTSTECQAYSAYPDYMSAETRNWWKNNILSFHENEIKFDGIWIDMNEPAHIRSFDDFSPTDSCDNNNPLNNPPYLPRIGHNNKNQDVLPSVELRGDTIWGKTVCMELKQKSLENNEVEVDHYDIHSLYGYSEALATLPACEEATGERCLVVSRSTSAGSNVYRVIFLK